MRTVKHSYTQEDLIKLIEATSLQQVEHAISYLSTWAMDSAMYSLCEIVMNSEESELVATYRVAEFGMVNYCLGAVWHGQHFGFHS